MAVNTLDLDKIYAADDMGISIANKYVEWDSFRRNWVAEKRELRDYLFATDTKTTSNASLGWKNSTTIPKLTQIRDNLHTNYMAALFSTDEWLAWEGASDEDEEKSDKIVSYMQNKCRQSDFETTISQLVLDYIDTGNAFAMSEFAADTYLDEMGILNPEYIGPRALRISPYDVVFNPLGSSFEKSAKIVRTIKTMGDIMTEVEDPPESGWLSDALSDVALIRQQFSPSSPPDEVKGHAMTVDGFSDIKHYYGSGYVELIEFHGDLYDVETDTLLRNYIITVADRRRIVRKQPNPSWTGKSRIKHAGWRLRPDNLYAMGPLDNLVGMQYRIDHLENLKADAFDMIAFPMVKIKGEVEDFDYAPGERIYTDEDGDVSFLHPDTAALNADNQIALLEQTMEEMAGAPKQALGIRTPGEKTKFEVQELGNAASRVFNHRITYFQEHVMLPLLNDMLEQARRNMDEADVIRVLDDEFGHVVFQSISKEDLSAKGTLRPVGARHFAAKANLVQTINGLYLSGMGADPEVMKHVSGKALAKLIIEDALDLKKYDLVQDNIRVIEQFETNQLMQSGQEATGVPGQPLPDLENEVPVEGNPI